MGEEREVPSKREGICVYLWLIHIVEWQKPIQHCKAAFLQLKNKCKKWKKKLLMFEKKEREIGRWWFTSFLVFPLTHIQRQATENCLVLHDVSTQTPLVFLHSPNQLTVLGGFFTFQLWCFCCCLVAKSCLLFYHPLDCSPPGSSVHEISQARTLQWVAISFSSGSSQPRDRDQISCISRQFIDCWASRDSLTQLELSSNWVTMDQLFTPLIHSFLIFYIWKCFWPLESL